MNLTFDQAIEILEITNMSDVKAEDIPRIKKRAERRWHPDTITHKNDEKLIELFTANFQLIEASCKLVEKFLAGELKAGQAFTPDSEINDDEPADVIRKNADEMQQKIKSWFTEVKEAKYMWHEEEIVLSDGFNLGELLDEDFNEDLASMSTLSLIYGGLFNLVISVFIVLFFPVLETLVTIGLFTHIIFCLLGILPLSRFWLPEIISSIMVSFINYGLYFYRKSVNMADDLMENEKGGCVFSILVMITVLLAKAVRFLVIWPVYMTIKIFVGNRVVGVVKQKVNYYANLAEWYIQDLINKKPSEMSEEELFHLSYFYGQLKQMHH